MQERRVKAVGIAKNWTPKNKVADQAQIAHDQLMSGKRTISQIREGFGLKPISDEGCNNQ
jgi:hypothetical protein